MTRVDWFALGFVALMALYGLRKGLIASAFSAAGVIGGAAVGARLAPHLLSGGSRSPYTPVAALGGAIVLAILLEAVGSLAGRTLRTGLRLPPLRALDSAGGFVLGAASGLAIVWVLGAAALLLPGQTSLRRSAQQSLVVRRLDAIHLATALELGDELDALVTYDVRMAAAAGTLGLETLAPQ